MLTPITIRTDYMRSQQPFCAGFLLPDGRHAIYTQGGVSALLPVIPFTHGLYAQDGDHIIIAHVSAPDNDMSGEIAADLYARLTAITGFDLLTTIYNPADEHSFLFIRDDADEDDDEENYDEYGRPVRYEH
jgi:hypothetical protein